MKTLLHAVAIALFAIGAAEIASAKEPVIDTSDPSKMTVDGLYPVKHSRIDVAFAREGLDLGPYDAVMVAPVSIAYQRKSYELNEVQVERMGRYFSETLSEELSDNGYQLVTTPGANVLLLQASIVDLRINRPTKAPVGRATVFAAESGEMTLIGELKDSMSGQILVRFADRQRPRSYWAKSTSISEWSEVRRAFRFWAGILTERLDAFHGSAD